MKQLPIIETPEKGLVFVIHKHDATRLHYDVRIQIGNVMPSWATSKGPTLEAGVKRLAIQTNDHGMWYRDFEGIIAHDYGKGTVMIWDEGTYTPEIEIAKGKRELVQDYASGQQVMKEGLKKGELKFTLHGKKLKGSFALIKTKNFGPKDSWLLMKHDDQYVEEGYDANTYAFSARSGKTLAEIAQEGLTLDEFQKIAT